jgi:diguanylate cyclase (GGDEF)-like protein/PAS domain S-box-containing protein
MRRNLPSVLYSYYHTSFPPLARGLQLVSAFVGKRFSLYLHSDHINAMKILNKTLYVSPSTFIFLGISTFFLLSLVLALALSTFLNPEPHRSSLMIGLIFATALFGVADALWIYSFLHRHTPRFQDQNKIGEEVSHEYDIRYALTLQALNEGVWDWDLHRNRIHFSSRWKDLLGYKDNELEDSIFEWFRRIHDDDEERFGTYLLTYLQGKINNFEIEYRLLHRDGSYRWAFCRGLALRDEENIAYHMAGSQSDITRIKSIEEQVNRQSFYDPLTQLPNRALLLDRLNHTYGRVHSGRQSHLALFFIDFDRFKVINDSMGHTAGDVFLVEVAARLKRLMRTVDTVARFGGDEFIILLDDVINDEEAKVIAERIKKELEAPFAIQERNIRATISIGILLADARYNSVDEIIRNVDAAMQSVKSCGGNGFSIFTMDMHAKAVQLMETEIELRDAVERKDFCLYYQPILSFDEGKIAGFEALLRWRRRDGQIVMPSDFIPMAEENGLIVPIGWWVLDEACRQLSHWQTAFPQYPPLMMSVNLSWQQLHEDDAIERVKKAIDATGIPSDSLCLEITESGLMKDINTATRTLEGLRKMGVKIEIDDFGTGYNTLGNLQKLPVSGLKIDRSFVMGIKDNQGRNIQFIHSIIDLAQNLSCRVVAEGVENIDQLNALKDMNCTLWQGFLFSHPISQTDVESLLATQHTHSGSY